MAERHPRDLDVVRQKLLKECRRPGFAEVARYRKPIGKGVEGPSIRFAEAAIRYMGNISIDSITIYDDREKRIIRVSVTDCEANVPYSSDITVEKTVERRSRKDTDEVVRTRKNSQGNLLYIICATEDDLLNKQNALVSKAIRTNGLRHVPGDIVEECMDEVLTTQRKRDAEDPDAAKRKVFDAFASIGVTVQQLKDYLAKDADLLTPHELSDLRGLYSAIREGETNWREVMDSVGGASSQKEDSPSTKSTTVKVKEKLQAKPAATIVNLPGIVVAHGDGTGAVAVWPKPEREPGEEE